MRPTLSRFRRLASLGWALGLRFFFLWACAGCRMPLGSLNDEGFCGRCWLRIPRIDGCVCQICGVPLRDGGARCYGCRQNPLSLMVRAATDYRFPIQQAIHRFKYAGRRTLTPALHTLLRYAWQLYPELAPVDFLIPVPLHRSTARLRGYNQSLLLAQQLGKQFDLPVLDRLLIRRRKTKPQFTLNRAERLRNLDQAFALASGFDRNWLKNKRLLLIDDVCTTGVTLEQCARTLRKAGAGPVKALVLARDI